MSSNPVLLPSGLHSLFPPGVVAAQMRGAGDPSLLLPAEADCVARAVPKRIREFAAGRQCARRALAEFGVAGFALRMAQDRQPLWPDGIIGSITHTAGLCMAAVAERPRFLGLGLDCEVAGAPSEDLWPTICRASELAWIHSLPLTDRSAAVTLIFSAKEAFYKCQYPVVGEWLDFHDLQIEVAAWGVREGAFELSPTRRIAFADQSALPVRGRFACVDAFVVTSVVVPVG